MFIIYNLISFAPLALVLHCLFIFLFKRWLGPIGTFYASMMSFSFVLVTSIYETYCILIHGNYVFVDFGR
jgi:hypothetical protein